MYPSIFLFPLNLWKFNKHSSEGERRRRRGRGKNPYKKKTTPTSSFPSLNGEVFQKFLEASRILLSIYFLRRFFPLSCLLSCWGVYIFCDLISFCFCHIYPSPSPHLPSFKKKGEIGDRLFLRSKEWRPTFFFLFFFFLEKNKNVGGGDGASIDNSFVFFFFKKKEKEDLSMFHFYPPKIRQFPHRDIPRRREFSIVFRHQCCRRIPTCLNVKSKALNLIKLNDGMQLRYLWPNVVSRRAEGATGQ